jgi:hypothetical protein
MKKPTQKEIIVKLMRSQPERKFFTYEMVKVNTEFGWLGSQGDRRMRELFEEGILSKEPRGRYERYWLREEHLKPEPKKKVIFINGQPTLIYA